MPRETAAASQQVLCTPYNHAPCHFMQSHTHKVYACLAVTCHLHFWQNDLGRLRATAVTRMRMQDLRMLKFPAAGKAWNLSYNYYADKLLAAVLLKDDVIVENDCVCVCVKTRQKKTRIIIRCTIGRPAFLFVTQASFLCLIAVLVPAANFFKEQRSSLQHVTPISSPRPPSFI